MPISQRLTLGDSMFVDVDFQYVGSNYLEEFSEESDSNVKVSGKDFHENICSLSEHSPRLIKATHSNRQLSSLERKVHKIGEECRIAPTGNISGEIGGKISWGGEEGVQGSVYASGSASDDNGNKAEATVEVNSDGSGSATVSASHEEETGS